MGFREANTIGAFSRISLRFEAPVSGETARQARMHAIHYPGENPFWPTFWAQKTATLIAGAREAHVPTLLFSGDAARVWPARYLTGSAPGAADGYGIAISYALAHQMWGSTDILGKRAYINDTPRIIRGIFEGTAPLALLPFPIEDTSQSWNAAELTGGTPHATRHHVESFALATGLGTPHSIYMGGAHALARFMAWFPIFLLALYGGTLCVRYIRAHHPKLSIPLLLSGLLLFALCLPFLLNRLPPWIIPNQWSDFSFWSALAQQASASLREFLSTYPTLRDVALNIHLLRQAGILFISLFCCASLLTLLSGKKADTGARFFRNASLVPPCAPLVRRVGTSSPCEKILAPLSAFLPESSITTIK